MTEQQPTPSIDALLSRRSLLRGAAAAAAVVMLPGRTAQARAATARPAPWPNIRVSRDRYGIHIMPSVATNPRDPRHLLASCLIAGSPAANPTAIATYLSLDGGASWQSGGVPRLPAGASGDDPTVIFDALGRGYLCATSYTDGRAVYLWRTDDGGRSFSAPQTVVTGQFCDHPWVATGQGLTGAADAVYVVWAAGKARQRGTGRHPNRGGVRNAIDFTRSTDGGQSFERPRRILPEASMLSAQDAAPKLAAGPRGLVCATCWWTTDPPGPTGDIVGHAVAVRSTNAGRTFEAPIHLGLGASVIQLPGGAMPNSDPSIAISPDGASIYVAFPTHVPGARRSDIVVRASHDRGQTWNKTVTVTPRDDAIYFQPNLAVDQGGRVAISAFALAHGRVSEVLFLSAPRSLRFGPPLQITTTPFDPHSRFVDRKYGAWWIGDYQGITANPDGFHLVWNDTRTGTLELFAATIRP